MKSSLLLALALALFAAGAQARQLKASGCPLSQYTLSTCLLVNSTYELHGECAPPRYGAWRQVPTVNGGWPGMVGSTGCDCKGLYGPHDTADTAYGFACVACQVCQRLQTAAYPSGYACDPARGLHYCSAPMPGAEGRYYVNCGAGPYVQVGTITPVPFSGSWPNTHQPWEPVIPADAWADLQGITC